MASARERNRRPETIKRALKEANIPSLTMLAVRLQKSRGLVSRVISGDVKSAPVATAIADILGTTPSDLWPRVYPKAS